MLRVLYTVEAEKDLQQIVDYIAAENLSAAIRWLDKTEALIGLLARQPGMGELIRTQRFGSVRRHATGAYAVYYRALDDCLQVLRVLHAARDHNRLL